jgi:site-specific recombinase XerD
LYALGAVRKERKTADSAAMARSRKVNFGLKSREMTKAGQFALNNAARNGHISYSTAATNGQRWQQFARWAKGQKIRGMERIEARHVIEYGQALAEKAEAGELAPATAQNAVRAINQVMHLASRGQWRSVSPTQDCGIGKVTTIRRDQPAALDRDRYERARAELLKSGMERAAAIADLARELGLRSKEASLLDARAALRQAKAQAQGRISITRGSKGGRKRDVPVRTDGQRAALARAASVQGAARSLVPEDQSWKEWREQGLRAGRELLQAHLDGQGYRDLRAAYACERFEQITGHPARCAGGPVLEKAADDAARAEISEELGHSRLDIMSEYIGGRS